MPQRKLHLEIFLVAFAIMLLDVSYTRVFSFKLVYYFTYVIIGIALLGIGAGGVMVAMFDGLRRAAVTRVLPVCCLAGGLGVLIGYFVVARTQLNTSDLVGAFTTADLAMIVALAFYGVGVAALLRIPAPTSH